MLPTCTQEKPTTPQDKPATRNPQPATRNPAPTPPLPPWGPRVYILLCARDFSFILKADLRYPAPVSLRLGFYGCLIGPCYQPMITDTPYVIFVTLVTGQ
jgi:hypothetical protein